MEAEFHRWLKETLPGHPRLPVPVGDDAALLQLDTTGCVVAVDTISDEVDFELRATDPRRIGHKALGVNLSDLAAMAAEPVACVVALMLPEPNAAELAREVILGMLPLAEEFDCPIAGGDVHVWTHPLALTVTVVGQQQQPVQRTGARVGNKIAVTGAFGGSILGRHLDVRPRIREMHTLRSRCEVLAAIDCSDGLSLDLDRLALASGVGAEIEAEQIPIHPDAQRLSEKTGRTPLQHALTDGEDFELILAIGADDAEELSRRTSSQATQEPVAAPLSIIGQFVEPPGLWIRQQDGSRQPLIAEGYQHGS